MQEGTRVPSSFADPIHFDAHPDIRIDICPANVIRLIATPAASTTRLVGDTAGMHSGVRMAQRGFLQQRTLLLREHLPLELSIRKKAPRPILDLSFGDTVSTQFSADSSRTRIPDTFDQYLPGA